MKLIFREAKSLRKSNAPWAGNVPDYWSAASLRWKTRIYAGGTPDKSKLEFWDNGDIPWLNSGSVNQYVIKKPSALITEVALKNSSTRWVPKGALLLALAGQGKTKGMVARLAIDSTCNQSVAAIVPDWDLNGIFLHYFLQDNYQKIRNLAGGDLRDGLNLDMLASITCPIPPLSEQRQIAAYLNRETTKIDKLIAKQQKLIKLLQEKRQAVISQAVTKGLGPNARMKDSGVAWLGEIPEHWKSIAYGRVLRIEQGCAFSSKDYCEQSSTQNFRMSNIGKGGLLRLEHSPKYLPDQHRSSHSRYRLHNGDLLIAMTDMSPNLDFLAIPTVFIDEASDRQFLLNQRVGRVRPKADVVDTEYLKYSLLSSNLRNQLKSKGLGTVQGNMSNSDLYSAYLALPPIDEQKTIVSSIEKFDSLNSNLINKSEAAIELLMEHRQALITAAVTGKIDVRGLVSDEEVAALDADPALETTEEDFESEVAEADYITEEE